MKNVVVVNNANQNTPPKRRQCYRLCGQACSKFTLSASEKAKKYFSRFYKFRQMDFEYASWQMVNIFVSPQKLYRNFSYHHCMFFVFLCIFSYSQSVGSWWSCIHDPFYSLDVWYVEYLPQSMLNLLFSAEVIFSWDAWLYFPILACICTSVAHCFGILVVSLLLVLTLYFRS